MKNKKIHIRIRDEDRARIQLIQQAHGCSMAAAIRGALIALCRQLGFEKHMPDDILRNDSK